MSAHQFPLRRPDLIWRSLDDQVVIVRPVDGQIRVLNQVAAFVWQAIDGTRSVGDLVEGVCAEYEVLPETAQADVLEFLDQLAGDGFLLLPDEE